jgi:uncharacterized membrane protein YhaH (DUF805 family)
MHLHTRAQAAAATTVLVTTSAMHWRTSVDLSKATWLLLVVVVVLMVVVVVAGVLLVAVCSLPTCLCKYNRQPTAPATCSPLRTRWRLGGH